MNQINSIFVYGTLQPGKQNGKILKKIKGTWKKGFVFGKLINISKGINYGYPVIEIKKKGDKIFGMVFLSKNLKKIINKLDVFEGKDYKRIITNVNLTNGTKIKSYIYIINNKLLYYKTTAKRWRKIYS